MKLSDIVLKPVTFEEYSDCFSLWYDRNITSSIASSYNGIINPWIFPSYDELLKGSLQAKFLSRVSVNNKGRWKKYSVSEIKRGRGAEVIDIASNDKIKKGHLELYFSVDYESNDQRIRIKFAEIEGLIVGYSVSFKDFHKGFFTWAAPPERGKENYYALCDQLEV